MLTSELLVTKIYKGTIEPSYADIGPGSLEIAESIIDVFRKNVGKTYGELTDEAQGIEEINYRLIRGLSQLLLRRCTIEQSSVIDPVLARKMVFGECSGVVVDLAERKKIIDSVAKRLSLTPEELEKSLWSDYEKNLVVKNFEEISAENLLKQYNLSLTQTLLFKASGMEIRAGGNYQQIFRKIKKLGLEYSIENDKIYLEGPASLFRMTDRYGTALAKLLPVIMQSGKWSIKAGIIRNTFDGKKILDFTLDSTRQIFSIENDDNEIIFDSAIEEEFYRHEFGDWTARREPAVLKAGQYAFIPDFSLEHQDMKIYVEIVGFWTPEYLRRKIDKINVLKERLLLLVDKNLACSGAEFKGENINVIFYDKKIPYAGIHKMLKEFEKSRLSREVEQLRLNNVEMSFDAEVIDISKLAEKRGASLSAIKEIIKTRKNLPENFLMLGNQLVSRKILEAVKNELENVKKYSEAMRILERHDIKAHTEALEHAGYKIKWNGLKPENAMIEKITHPS